MSAPRPAVAACVILLAVACGGSPAAPGAGDTTPPAAARLTVTGVVSRGDGQPISGATVDVTSGADTGRSTQTGADGRYQLTQLSAGTLTLVVSAPGFSATQRTLTLAADATSDFTLAAQAGGTAGRVVDALSGSGVAGVVVEGPSIHPTLSDLAGRFSVGTDAPMAAPRVVFFRRDGFVPRETALRVPGLDALVSVIASSFDLTAFDEMFRSPVLRRWASAPPLHVIDRVLIFEGVFAATMEARDVGVSAGDRQSIVDDLAWGLPQLTGGAFSGFTSVAIESPAPGSRVPVLNTGRITFARVEGLTASTGLWGYGRWQRVGDEIIAGLIMVDSGFDTSGSQYRRSLRVHELGHALGYNHVTMRPSVMNSSARIEPTSFDLDAARLAFDRPPGNRAPDIDPSAFSTNRVQVPVWGPPIR